MNANSNASGRENGDETDISELEARAHLEAIAETDLPYAEYAERALRKVDEQEREDRGGGDE